MTLNRDDKAFAGEYVLGLLEGDAKAEAERRIASDADFARAVEDWRMRLLAFAAASLTAAIIGTAFQNGHDAGVEALTAALASASGLSFLLGIAPPGIVRVLWRTREQQRLQEAIRGLMTLATTRGEVAERVAPGWLRAVGRGSPTVRRC